MATLKYSFFPLMKFILYSSLLSALFSCSPVKIQALETKTTSKNRQFHTIQISSLLPASVCTHSTVSSKRPSTLEVYHKHGPCYQPSKENPTITPPLSEILYYDQIRVESIQARLKPDSKKLNTVHDKIPNKAKFDDEKANVPVQSGAPLDSGNYVVPIGLGTPKKPLSLIFDTGSNLAWTQCQPCAVFCYKQQDPIFDPSASSSYSNISCGSSECDQLGSATGINPSCSAGTCVYAVQYGDRSFSVGFFSKETLTLAPTDVFPNIMFGCGQNNQGLFGKTDGLIGFGRDPLSIMSQTSKKYGKYFSYCLPSTLSSTGHLTLGKPNGTSSSNIKFTPFDKSRGTEFYYIDITGISVGGDQLPINGSVFKASAGTIIDSGTVITRLPPGAYAPMRTAFRKLMSEYPTAPDYAGFLDTCYNFSGYTSITIPSISFIFNGGVKVDLDASGIIVPVNVTQAWACLAFADNGGARNYGIFGNIQQQTLEVVYDVAGERLGFGSGGCE